MRFSRYRGPVWAVGVLLALAIVAAGDALLVAGGIRLVNAMRSRGEGASPVAAYPAGWWQRYTDAPDGYVLALPPEWRVVPLAADALSRFAEAGGGNADLAQRLAARAQERTEAGAGLWAAAAPDGPLGAMTSLNIVRQPLEQDLSVGDFARANVAALRQGDNPPASLEQEWLSLTAGRALRAQMTYRLSDAGGQEQTLAVTQFFLVHGQSAYVITATTRPDQAEDYAPIFDGIVRSLRWTE